MNKEEFKNYFWEMEAMKYYEGNKNSKKALDMIENKDNNYIAMRKYDGEWNMAIILDNGKVLMRGRNRGVSGDFKDRAASLPHITKLLTDFFPSGTVLLGEIAFEDPSKTAKDVGTIMRCLPAKALERQKQTKLHFYIFDILAYSWNTLIHMPFYQRFMSISESVNSYIHFAEIRQNDFMDYAEEVWSKKGEGILIIKKDISYSPGSRTSWNSLKIKKTLEEMVFPIIDFIDPNKNYEGTEINNWNYWVDENDNPADLNKMIDYGKLIPVTKPYYFNWKNGVIVKNKDKLIRVTSGMSDENRAWLATTEAKEKLNKNELFAIVTGMEMTEDGSIRHPVIVDIKK